MSDYENYSEEEYYYSSDTQQDERVVVPLQIVLKKDMNSTEQISTVIYIRFSDEKIALDAESDDYIDQKNSIKNIIYYRYPGWNIFSIETGQFIKSVYFDIDVQDSDDE
jgi:hypothetical protein